MPYMGMSNRGLSAGHDLGHEAFEDPRRYDDLWRLLAAHDDLDDAGLDTM